MSAIRKALHITCISICLSLPLYSHADNLIKLGMSLPLSGSGANWGIGANWLCQQAARDISAKGGIKIGADTYNVECVAYDNKYNAADGAKVAQTLLSKDRVSFISGSLGTAPVRALQSLAERRGVLMFTSAWGTSLKGPEHPLTFTQMNTPNEIVYPMVRFVKEQHPEIKTVALLNPNDATGQETEAIARKAWEEVGVQVVASDWFERGTSEFQPIAAKLAAMKPDVVDLCSTTPADSGQVFRELTSLGWDGIKMIEVGTGADGLIATGGRSAENTYMGAAVALDPVASTELQRRLDAGIQSVTGESINAVQIGFYDSVIALAAAMEKAQSIKPADVAAALPQITFDSFYGVSAFGGEDVYGSPQQILVPVIVTQIQNGKLVEVSRIQPAEMTARLQ